MLHVNGHTPKSRLKQIAGDAGVRLQDVLVLAPANDPFNCGGPQQVRQAEWFADVWNSLMGEQSGHIRKCWYRAVSQPEPIRLPDGTPLLNTDPLWQKFQTWSKYARYLGLIDPLKIVDNRNPDPHLLAPEPVTPPQPGWELQDWWGFTIPSIERQLYAEFDLPDPIVTGYGFCDGEQPYLLELWSEKSTMDEEVLPICREFGVNLVTSTGFQSVTNAIGCYSRAAQWAARGYPVRIFYLSDFDPAGDSMPVAVSRQIEFWREQYGPDVDIAVAPMALTREQVAEYRLPTIPIKATDRRKEAFESRHGVDGAVELDALEAIYPGQLAEVLSAAFSQYRDTGLRARLIVAHAAARQLVADEWSRRTGHLREQAESLQTRMEEIAYRYEPRLRALSDEFGAEIGDLRDEAEQLEHHIHELRESSIDIALPPRPVAEVDPPDESQWLFASGRTFAEQLTHYRKHQGKP